MFLVYCACLLGCHSVPLYFETGTNPLFFTNIFDIPKLAMEHKYIACKCISLYPRCVEYFSLDHLVIMLTHFACLLLGTTEKIFENKTDLFDVYVDKQNIKCQPYLSPLQHANSYDRNRYNRLLEYR